MKHIGRGAALAKLVIASAYRMVQLIAWLLDMGKVGVCGQVINFG